MNLSDFAGQIRGDRNHGLVGFNFDDILLGFNNIALIHEHRYNVGRLDVLTQFRKFEFCHVDCQ